MRKTEFILVGSRCLPQFARKTNHGLINRVPTQNGRIAMSSKSQFSFAGIVGLAFAASNFGCGGGEQTASGEVTEPAPDLRDRSFEHAERDRCALLDAVHAIRDRQVRHEIRR